MEGNDFAAHITLGAVAVYTIEHLKASGWFPWLTQDTKTLNRLVSVAFAFVSAIGISITYDPSVGGVIQVPALSTLLLGLWEVIKQYTTQQILFDGVVAPASRKELTVKLAAGDVALPVPKVEP